MGFMISDAFDHQLTAYEDGPRLLADIGGTNARFALEYAPGRIGGVHVLRGTDYPGVSDAVAAYLNRFGNPGVHHACVAIANPVQGDAVRMTNHDWAFSIEATRKELKLDTFMVVNDFTALAMSLPYLGETDCLKAGGGTAREGKPMGLVGAGTGLGVGGLVFSGGRPIALESEGGHATFSPADEREVAILEYCWGIHSHVSAERLVSGPGIELIYRALAAQRRQENAEALGTPEIIRRAMDGSDPLCVETVECFCGMLGTVASNVALTLGALGGVYIGGGIVPRLGEYFLRSPFRSRFEAKGRFAGYLSEIPVLAITASYPAFYGAAAILDAYLSR
jgi:glucokinase